MEMLAARMRADLAETPSFMLGIMFVKTREQVDHLNSCENCRKERGAEFHAVAVLHLGLIEQEISNRGQDIKILSVDRSRSRFAAALNPSMN